MFDYSFFMLIGFWFTLGILQALLVSALLWKFLSWVVDPLFRDPKLKLPPYVKNMVIKKSSKYVVARAEAFNKVYAHTVTVASHDSLKAAVAAVQIELVAKIAEDEYGSKYHQGK